MKKINLSKMRLMFVAVVLSLSAVGGFVQPGRASNPNEPPSIRVAPAAPVFSDAERVTELAARRARVAEKIGPKSILVLFSGEPRVYTNDVSYEFRQENNLFYLTHLKQRGATLVLVPGNASMKEVLFLPRRNPAAETWTGHMYSAEEARRISGVSEIWEAKEFEPFMQSIRARRAYRPQAEGVLLSASTAAAQPVTPPVPKSDQTPAAAS
ncbi:MAG TPA: aminopeptidase P N-terminal domain-containing protein, partial [Pyrinomonadaceae bacterium]|nr:aminopeptidase P N-terminal domain-containing protein [Pyrinomonadaceae bacterium]